MGGKFQTCLGLQEQKRHGVVNPRIGIEDDEVLIRIDHSHSFWRKLTCPPIKPGFGLIGGCSGSRFIRADLVYAANSSTDNDGHSDFGPDIACRIGLQAGLNELRAADAIEGCRHHGAGSLAREEVGGIAVEIGERFEIALGVGGRYATAGDGGAGCARRRCGGSSDAVRRAGVNHSSSGFSCHHSRPALSP